MSESLTQREFMCEEGVCRKALSDRKIMTVLSVKKHWQRSVPAAAVIQTVQALFRFIGRKGYVGGSKNYIKKTRVITLVFL